VSGVVPLALDRYTRYRRAGMNLRTNFQRIIAKAGLEPWPKLFQNLRATRQTELCEHWPEHVVCAWIGNSQQVARKHYLQVTDEHFERAAQLVTPGTARNAARPETACSYMASQGSIQATESAPHQCPWRSQDDTA